MTNEYVDSEDPMETDHDVLKYFFQVERLHVKIEDGHHGTEHLRLPLKVGDRHTHVKLRMANTVLTTSDCH